MANLFEGESTPNPVLSVSGRHVLQMAQDEAQKLLHGYIGTEHILLGLAREETFADAFKSLNAPLDSVRQQVEGVVGTGDRAHTQNPPELTPSAKDLIYQALQDAKRQGLSEVTPENFLNSLYSTIGIGRGILDVMRLEKEALLTAAKSLKQD